MKITAPAAYLPLFNEVIAHEVMQTVLYSGRDSGKSATFARRQLLSALEYRALGKQGRIISARSFKSAIKESFFCELETALIEEPELALNFEIGASYLRTREGMIDFSFPGCNVNSLSLKGLSGAFGAVVDEADGLNENGLKFLRPTVRKEPTGSFGGLAYLFNPSTPNTVFAQHFLKIIDGAMGRSAEENLYRSFYDRKKRLLVIFSNYTQNPFLSNMSKFRIEQDRLNLEPEDFDNIYGGKFITQASGAYFARQLRRLYNDGRHVDVLKLNPNIPVYVAWDLGRRDRMCVIVYQIIRDVSGHGDDRIIILDMINGTSYPVEYYATELKDRGYSGAICYLPHDGTSMRSYTIAATADECLRNMGFKTVVIPNQGEAAAMQRIQKLRGIFKRLWFNQASKGCKRLLECLGTYAPKMVNGKATDTPDHNSGSDEADAMGLIPYCYEKIITPDKNKEFFKKLKNREPIGGDKWNV